jgi:thiamine biosynthesis lipoprotein
MGTGWTVRLAGRHIDAALLAAAQAAVAAALSDVVARMSTFDPGSELVRLNRHASTQAFAVSPQLMAVLARADEVARRSAGAFDPTVAPLVGAWGFGAGAAERTALPEPVDLAQPVGWQRLVLDSVHGHALKDHPALALDLSGIAKGHAVDLAAKALDALGLRDYMVEAGGEIRVRGRNLDEGRAWQIAVERPDVWPRQVQRVLPLTDLAIATSGDYRNFYLVNGRRIHHQIDPATREPSRHALASVSVVHPECMSADAWATALFVRGADEGLQLARAQGLAALFIVRHAGGELREVASPAFKRLA